MNKYCLNLFAIIGIFKETVVFLIYDKNIKIKYSVLNEVNLLY